MPGNEAEAAICATPCWTGRHDVINVAARDQKKKNRRRAQSISPQDRHAKRSERAAARSERRLAERQVRRKTEEAAAAAARAKIAAFDRSARARRLEIEDALAAGARPCPNCNGYIRPDTLICADTPWCDLWWRKAEVEAEHPTTADLRRERLKAYRKASTGHCEHPDCPSRADPSAHSKMNVHHLSYQAAPGTEPDSHLILLCEHCHKGDNGGAPGGVHGLIMGLRRSSPVGPIRHRAIRARGFSDADRTRYGDATTFPDCRAEWCAPF